MVHRTGHQEETIAVNEEEVGAKEHQYFIEKLELVHPRQDHCPCVPNKYYLQQRARKADEDDLGPRSRR